MNRRLLTATASTVPITLRGAWWSKWTVRCQVHGWESRPYWLASTVISIARMHVSFDHREYDEDDDPAPDGQSVP